jgi:hypothetical protein
MSSEENHDEKPFNLDDLGLVEGEEVVGEGEVVGQGEVVGEGEVVGQGDKQPDNKRKRSEWSQEFLAKQNKPIPAYIEQRQRSLERQQEGLSLNNLRLMNEEIGDFTKEQVDDIGSRKRQKKDAGSRKKRSKSKMHSMKQKRSRKQKRSKNKTRSRKQSKNRRRSSKR